MIRSTSLALIVSLLFCLSLHATPPPDSPPAKRIQVMIVGTHYLPADIMRNSRQKEVNNLVGQLGRFQPDQVMVHVPYASEGEANLNADFRLFQTGMTPLNRSVEQQLGFRLAQQVGVSQLHGIDDLRPLNLAGALEATSSSTDQSNIDLLLRQGRGIESTKQWHSMKSSVREYLLYLNQQENLQYEHSILLNGLGHLTSQDQYVGADILTDWYAYHLRMYSNLNHMLAQEHSERVVIFLPSTHVPILKELIVSDPALEWVEANSYLTVQ